jgi:phosphopantothenoylcysteine synthetase/decarboxylase
VTVNTLEQGGPFTRQNFRDEGLQCPPAVLRLGAEVPTVDPSIAFVEPSGSLRRGTMSNEAMNEAMNEVFPDDR